MRLAIVSWRRHLRRGGIAAAVLVLAAGVGIFALDRLDKAYPPPLGGPQSLSREVLDRHGAPLSLYANEAGRWRLKTDIDREGDRE